jgi:hypothetical protein
MSGDCWNWKAARFDSGYGAFRHIGKQRRAHRVAWEFVRGPVPDGLCVLHSCDNPKCVKPSHLWLGTFADNNKDKSQKGRSSRGEKGGSAAYGCEGWQIRASTPGETNRSIAKDCGVSDVTIGHCSAPTWRHIEARRCPVSKGQQTNTPPRMKSSGRAKPALQQAQELAARTAQTGTRQPSPAAIPASRPSPAGSPQRLRSEPVLQPS